MAEQTLACKVEGQPLTDTEPYSERLLLLADLRALRADLLHAESARWPTRLE